ncbi:GNAT family N-acetyltransferase [Erythrobacter sanguineus]|jgi:CelD/BcsL family acetyltransferase involved in cellulose biosynthesis|uniref:Acetyltransferase (GNAT) domain-containing protein n=1 Tax=Erythrobacter sanguineus TaxID=198312 RepID=A0A1M7SSN5_9SPHN|nr:GNAT family N-acetyltransferase [Erythrobacter sanguineus]SHN61535.1 Acetyltransferase (GNAT) domain-containing protein [Erythrobacter sanguineus]
MAAAQQQVGIDFTIGARRLLAVQRSLATWSFTLDQVLSGTLPDAPEAGPDGLRVLSAPTGQLAAIAARYPGFVAGGRQDYRRHYIDMSGSFADYLAQFSGKTRSTLRRKARKLAEETGGYTVSEHRTPVEIEAFLAAALPLSARTYQARLLDAGLPDSPAARRAIMEAAGNDRMRAFLLHAGDQPIAYLSLPVTGPETGGTLVYAHLGYDPDHARLSPGTVLQMDALERLFAEGRYRWFDFTEGDGAHKAMFGTDSAACSSLVLLRPTLANRSLLGARSAFDAGVAQAKALAASSGALERIRARLRA